MARLARRMTKPKPPQPPPPAYDWREIAGRIRREVGWRSPVGEGRPLSVKELATRVHPEMAGDAWLRKKLGATTRGAQKPRTPFTIEECGIIARMYAAPRGWPFLDVEWPGPEG